MASTMATLKAFLAQSRLSLRAAQSQPIHLVLGNEAADLDSVASALVTAWQLSRRNPANPVVPVINTVRCDLVLRTEVDHVLRRLAISQDDLTFIEDLNLRSVTGVTLVDHNRLATGQDHLKPMVTAIIDHHTDEWDTPLTSKTIEPVGSCSSLVCLADWPLIQTDPIACELLLSAILVDTINLDASKGRCLAQDRQAADMLLRHMGLEQEATFQRVQSAKFDVAHLTMEQLLRKDFKKIQTDSLAIGIPAIGLSLEELSRRPEWIEALSQFQQETGTDVLVVMTMFQEPQFTRQLALFNGNVSETTPAWQQQLQRGLESSELQLNVTPSTSVNLQCYKQQAQHLSRKKVIPLILELLA
eukprot:TRINITY_DN2818_c0_g1_i1.p1 TRINITY_DN2818_c0_g1~~TRINITY_DN2818_c0_g1_i1.p1  ORF type:complete len:359 (+),score=80.15 TRINITY_DN2818_c0_g1_i1:56-1132(+)